MRAVDAVEADPAVDAVVDGAVLVDLVAAVVVLAASAVVHTGFALAPGEGSAVVPNATVGRNCGGLRALLRCS